MHRYLYAAAFAATVVAANWALRRWGVVPVGFGLMAPAGVYAAGVAFGLRDGLHEAGGVRWVLGAIAAGALLSYVIEAGDTLPGGHVPLAVASAVAFAVSELADLAVYAPLRRRQWGAAVVASNVVGAVADSLLFLWLAFGAVEHWPGNVVGKVWMIPVGLAVVAVNRRAIPRHTLRPAGV